MCAVCFSHLNKASYLSTYKIFVFSRMVAVLAVFLACFFLTVQMEKVDEKKDKEKVDVSNSTDTNTVVFCNEEFCDKVR